MLAEQSVSNRLTDLQNSHDEPPQVICLPKRNVNWLTSLVHYFAFGVDAYLLLIFAEKAAANHEPCLADTELNLVESTNNKLREHAVSLGQKKSELVSLLD